MAERQFMERRSVESDGLSLEKNSDKNISFSSDKNTGENGKYQQDACDKEPDVKASPLELTMAKGREQAKPHTSKDRLHCDHTTYARRAQKRKVAALNAQTSAHKNKRLRTESSSSSDSTSTNETTHNQILRQKDDIANDSYSSKGKKVHVVMEDDEPGTLQGDTSCNADDSTLDVSLEHASNNPDVDSMDLNPDTSTPTGSKKTKKTVFPFCQKVVLLMAYNRNKYPSSDEYVQLSKALDVPVLPIKNWFHNRRNRERPQLQLNDARSPQKPDTRTSMSSVYHTPMPLYYTQHALVHLDQNYLFPYNNIYGSYVSSYIGPGTSGFTPNLNAERKTQDHREPEIRINCSRQQVLETSKPLVVRQSVVESPTENLECQTLRTDHSSSPEPTSTNRQTPNQIQTQKDYSANDSCSSKGKKLFTEDTQSSTLLADASSNTDDSTPDLSLEHSFTGSSESSMDSAPDASNPPRRKRERTVFTPYQLDSLNALFNRNNGRIDQDTHNKLCTTLNLPRTVIANWFTNKRRAAKRQVKTNRPHLIREERSDAMSDNSVSYARERNMAYDSINPRQIYSYPEKNFWIYNYCRQQIPKMSNSPVVNRERVVEATLMIARRNLFPMGIPSVSPSVVNNGFISQLNPDHLMLQPLAPLDLTMPKGGDQSKTRLNSFK